MDSRGFNGVGDPSSGEEVPEADSIPEGDEPSWDDLIISQEELEKLNPIPATPRKRLTRQRAKQYQQVKAQGFIFTLNHTLDEDGKPMDAVVRRVTFADKEFFHGLPKSIQNQLINLNLERVRRQRETTPETITPSTFMRQLGSTREMANAYCIAGFVDPRVYATEADADRFDGVWVEDIDVNDRMVFLGVCEGSWEDARSVLTPFLEQSPRSVATGETVPNVSRETPESDDPFAGEAELPRLVPVEN